MKLETTEASEIAKEPSRHYLLLIDGTSLSANRVEDGSYHSNVYNISLFLETHNLQKEAQIAFYNRGVSSSIEKKKIKEIHGVGLRELIETSYLNIAMNYNEGDETSVKDKIYIFGFSRGAYAAQVVCNLIDTYGLLRPGCISEFDKIFEHWVSGGISTISDLEAFQFENCAKVVVEFCGIFDSVLGAYSEDKHSGALRNKQKNSSALPSCVKHAVHLLSIDDSRKAFAPEIWSRRSNLGQRLEQIWMPGGHTDIGGGYKERLLSDIALVTMLELMRETTDLKFDESRLEDARTEIRINSARYQAIYIHNAGRDNPFILLSHMNRSLYLDKEHIVHPFALYLDGRDVLFRGKKRPYDLDKIFKDAEKADPGLQAFGRIGI